MTSGLFFDTALLPDGWAERVAIEVDASGIIRRVEAGVTPARDTPRGRSAGAAQPAQPHLPARDGGPRRGRRALGRPVSGPGARSCTGSWTGSGPTMSRRSLPRPSSRCWRWASRASPSSIICIKHPTAGPTPTRPSSPQRIVAAAGAAGIGLTLLPVLYGQGDFGGAAPTPGQRRFLHTPATFFAPPGRAALPVPGSGHRYRPALLAGRGRR